MEKNWLDCWMRVKLYDYWGDEKGSEQEKKKKRKKERRKLSKYSLRLSDFIGDRKVERWLWSIDGKRSESQCENFNGRAIGQFALPSEVTRSFNLFFFYIKIFFKFTCSDWIFIIQLFLRFTLTFKIIEIEKNNKI